MDVITSVESCDKFFIARQMCKDSELYLRVIRTDQDVFFIIGCKGFSKGPSKFLPDGDVLQVGFCTAYPARSGNYLLKMCSDLSVCGNKRFHAFHIGGIKLGEISVFQYFRNDRMFIPDLFQDLSVCAVPALGLFAERKPQVFKQDISQLHG